MNIKEIVVYATNGVVVVVLIVAVILGKVQWTVASAVVAALLVPSAGHVAVQRLEKNKEDKDEDAISDDDDTVR